MAKEVLIYGGIHSLSAFDFITSVNEIKDGEDLVVRINTDGGSPEYGFGMVAKFREFEGNKSVKVDGKAHSAGMFFCTYAEKVEALSVSQFLVHRAAYSEWFEDSTLFTEELKTNLVNINKDLQRAFEAKVDVAKFEEISGVTVKEIFSMDSRKDVFLTATQAKKIGLINKVVNITPTKQASLDSMMEEVVAKYSGKALEQKEIKNEKNITNPIKQKNMDLNKLKAEHHALYAEVLAVGKEAGIAAEKDRIGAYLAFVDADPKAVVEGIKSGKSLSATQMAEFVKAQVSKTLVNDAEKENAPEVETPKADAPKSAEEISAEASEAELDAELGINKEKIK
jgi:ATP-dependent protease ClpP protease subunit